MAMVTSGQLSLGTTAGTDRSIGAAVSGYTNTSNISLKDVSNAATSGTNPADGAPFEMEEFYGYAELIPFTLTGYVTLSTSSRAFRFFDQRTFNGTTIAAAGWEIYHTIDTITGGTHRHEWYVSRRAGDSVNVYGHATQNFLSHGSSIKIARVDVSGTFGRPNSYRLNESISSSSGGPAEPLNTVRGNGFRTFEDNPPNTDYTYPTITVPASARSTGQNMLASQLVECYSGSASHDYTYSVVYKKTGRADTTIFSFTIGADFSFSHVGFCP